MLKIWENKNILSLCLLPFSYLYGIIFNLLFHLKKPKHFSKKIICIGNATIGGAGKTPTSIEIAKLLQKKGKKIVFALKNYGSNSKESYLINEKSLYRQEIIEEAFLLARYAPTYVASKRFDAIQEASKTDCDYIIVDDGIQNNSFYKDISILVVDGVQKFGNEFLLPAGPLRQKITTLMKKVNLIIGINIEDDFFLSKIKKFDKKLFKATSQLDIEKEILSKEKFIAFAGIGYPKKFFKSLKRIGAKIIATKIFPDHYKYKKNDLEKLNFLAKKYNARLITTEKDAIKIENSKGITIPAYRLVFLEEDELGEVLINEEI